MAHLRQRSRRTYAAGRGRLIARISFADSEPRKRRHHFFDNGARRTAWRHSRAPLRRSRPIDTPPARIGRRHTQQIARMANSQGRNAKPGRQSGAGAILAYRNAL